MGQDLTLPILQVLRRIGHAERRHRALLIAGGTAALSGGLLLAHGLIARFVPLGISPIVLIGCAVMPVLVGGLSLLVRVSRERTIAALSYEPSDQSLFLAALADGSTRLSPIVSAAAAERAAHWLKRPFEHRPLPQWTRGGFMVLMLGAALSFAPGILSQRSDELAGLLTLAEDLLRQTESNAIDHALNGDQRAALKSESKRLRQAAAQEDAPEIAETIRRIEDLLGRMIQASNPAPPNRSDPDRPSPSSELQTRNAPDDSLVKLKQLVEALRAGEGSLADAQLMLQEIKGALAPSDEADRRDLAQAEVGLGSGDGTIAAESLGKLLTRYEERHALLKRALDVIVVSRGVGASSDSEQPFAGNLRAATETTPKVAPSTRQKDTSAWIPANIELTDRERIVLSRYFDGRDAPIPPSRR